MGRLEAKVAIVTGAGQGIGQGIALALAREGAAVAVVGRTESKLVATCRMIEERGGNALPIACDVTERSQINACVDRALERFGRLDILVNNAQAVPAGTLLELTEEVLDEGWKSGPLATFRFMRAAYPHLRATRGAIINLGTGTQWSHGGDAPFHGGYAAVKDAIMALTRAAAVEWGSDGIRALLIVPSALTPLIELYKERLPEQHAARLKLKPLGRHGDADVDIGRAVAWLCSEEAGYITGTTVMLDGGQMYLR
jgi:NAD(P)-dependent dehydrogenase (short-subunit alcohol dehydrogenase family)